MARARTAGNRSHANRNRHGRWLAAVVLAGLPLLASGHGYRLGNIAIRHPWAMPTDAVATTDCRLAAVDNRRFLRLVAYNPPIALQLLSILAERLRQADADVVAHQPPRSE